jgi:hypothetical protein
MNSDSPDYPITDFSRVPARIACPGCGKLLTVRVLAEKHHCDRVPRKPWRLDPETLAERRKCAAERRFQCRMVRRTGGDSADDSARV